MAKNGHFSVSGAPYQRLINVTNPKNAQFLAILGRNPALRGPKIEAGPFDTRPRPLGVPDPKKCQKLAFFGVPADPPKMAKNRPFLGSPRTPGARAEVGGRPGSPRAPASPGQGCPGPPKMADFWPFWWVLARVWRPPISPLSMIKIGIWGGPDFDHGQRGFWDPFLTGLAPNRGFAGPAGPRGPRRPPGTART